jgi:hypothetical protein
MSYAPVRGLGWTGTISMKTPWGTERASLNVPIEQAANAAMNAVWPIAEQKMVAMLPGLMDMALKRAGGYVTGDLWPQMRPLLRKEVDRAVLRGEVVADDAVDTATERAAMLGGALILTITGAAWWVSRRRRR